MKSIILLLFVSFTISLSYAGEKILYEAHIIKKVDVENKYEKQLNGVWLIEKMKHQHFLIQALNRDLKIEVAYSGHVGQNYWYQTESNIDEQRIYWLISKNQLSSISKGKKNSYDFTLIIDNQTTKINLQRIN